MDASAGNAALITPAVVLTIVVFGISMFTSIDLLEGCYNRTPVPIRAPGDDYYTTRGPTLLVMPVSFMVSSIAPLLMNSVRASSIL